MTIKSQLTHSRCESSCTIARKISHRWGLGRWTFMCCRRGFLLFSHGWASFFAGLLPLPCDKTKSCDNTRNEFDERTRNEKIKEIERHVTEAGPAILRRQQGCLSIPSQNFFNVQSVCCRLSRAWLSQNYTLCGTKPPPYAAVGNRMWTSPGPQLKLDSSGSNA